LGREKERSKKKVCPLCGRLMKRKGSFRNKYWKCLYCKTKVLADGTIVEYIEDKTMRDYYAKMRRKELAKKKLIKRLKRKKYIPKVFEWGGEIINLDEYDDKGNPIKEEKKTIKVKEEENGSVS